MTRSLHYESDQKARYEHFYQRRIRLRELMRFDVRYRCRRMHEVLAELGIPRENRDVLDVGFGSGAMLASFPHCCRIFGADVSVSAVSVAEARFKEHAAATFVCVDEESPELLPKGPFDIIISSHTLEHVPDDLVSLEQIRQRLRPGGHLVLFVPIEEPDYIEFHVRNYSMQSLQNVVQRAGLQLRFVEPSMHINGHLWKLITIPSRRHWPGVKHVVDTLRTASLSTIPYAAVRKLDAALHRLGFGPRQGLVIAQRACND